MGTLAGVLGTLAGVAFCMNKICHKNAHIMGFEVLHGDVPIYIWFAITLWLCIEQVDFVLWRIVLL